METHEQILGNSYATFSMVYTGLSGLIILMSADILNPIFCINLMIFFKFLQRDTCYGLEPITTSLNVIERPWWLLQDTHISLWQRFIFYSWNLWNHIKYIWGGIRTTKPLYKINLDTWSCIVLLDIVIFSCFYILLLITEIGFTIDEARITWLILKVEAGLYHYHCTFYIYE